MTPDRRTQARDVLVLIHRYTGLCIAIFLVVAGVTGSILAFGHSLDAWINPHLHHLPPSSTSQPVVNPFELRETVAANLGKAVNEVRLDLDPGDVWKVLVEGRETYVNPHDGSILGSREWGNLSEGFRLNLIPFVLRLHFSLALGDVGTWLFGIVALLWTLDCFVGIWLTLPPKRRLKAPDSRKSWLRRWLPSWTVKTGNLFSSIFTFHRATGLWLWAMLLVFAWSSVGFNLQSVYQPVMRTFGYRNLDLPELTVPRDTPVLNYQAAHAIARGLMQNEAQANQWTIHREAHLRYNSATGLYAYSVFGSLDLGSKFPGTTLWLDGDTGDQQKFYSHTGQTTANSFSSWLIALHLGDVGGLPYKMILNLIGLLIAALSVSGVFIWWRKRKIRVRRRSDP
ncbi:PepSY domain-containing protein [Phragmitibacter flavus]|uniref:PepSY domain-containing protein n=1 Tax=Phragmitibacter flavus TaxID=2576071 RepID=A0A5R8KDZ5_9BACT|nr:PepSY-associated TM helix domain-containing protein [Phragmitibacter flavus]TLD70511.1 PepSY domain-containing protein [Phragmitibacter flavus]